MYATPTPAAPAAVAFIDFDTARVTVAHVRCGDTGGHLHVRLRPADALEAKA